MSRFDRPGPHSDVDDFYETNGRFMRPQPSPDPVPEEWATCVDCQREFLRPVNEVADLKVCGPCLCQRIRRTAEAMRRDEVTR